jgi:TonB family protein
VNRLRPSAPETFVAPEKATVSGAVGQWLHHQPSPTPPPVPVPYIEPESDEFELPVTPLLPGFSQLPNLPLVSRPWVRWGVLSGVVHALGIAVAIAIFSAKPSPVANTPPSLPGELELQTQPSNQALALEINLPSMVGIDPDTARVTKEEDKQPPLPQPSGGEHLPRPDTEHTGKSGDNVVPKPALNLADRDDGIALTKYVQSRIDRSQLQRMKQHQIRQSMDDRRAVRNPMDLTFLVIGKGKLSEDRLFADTHPKAGHSWSTRPTRLGAERGVPETPPGEGESMKKLGLPVIGSLRISSGSGTWVPNKGHTNTNRAPTQTSKPMVSDGRPANPANNPGTPQDNQHHSNQEIAATVQSLLHASTAGGKHGEGRGGEKGKGTFTGSGGVTGIGSHSKTLGQGKSGPVELNGMDPRLSNYRRRVLAKINPLWSFPRWAAIEGRQGFAIVSMTILANGSVTGVRLIRTSGITEFDNNVVQAIFKAAPFEPLPANLNTKAMNWAITFDALNPSVR